MIDAIGMREVNRWLALAQLDGWGEEHRMRAIIAAKALGCSLADLLPYEPAPTAADVMDVPAAGETLAKLSRLAGF